MCSDEGRTDSQSNSKHLIPLKKSTKGYGKIHVAFSPLTISIILNVIWLFAVLLLCDSKYEVSDDFVISSILAGGYCTYTAYTPYVNICLSKVIKLFYIISPQIGWFYVYLIFIGFLSFTIITWLFLTKNGFKMGVILSLFVLLFLSDDIYVVLTYTKTASFAVLAGGSLVVYTLWKTNQKENKLWLTKYLIGSITLIGGGLLRKESFFLIIPFLFLFFSRYLFLYFKDKTLIVSPVGIIQNLVFFLIPLLSLVIAVLIDNWGWKNTYNTYFYYNSLRSAITDTATYGYSSVKEQFVALGLDETDFNMIYSWNLMDQDIYSDHILKNVAEIKQNVRNERSHSLNDMIQRASERNMLGYWAVIGVLTAYTAMIFLDKQNRFFRICVTILSLAMLSYFYWIDRVVWRVEYGIIAGLLTGILLFYEGNKVNEECKNGFARMLLLFFILHLWVYIPDQNFCNMSNEEYINYRKSVLTGSGSYKATRYRIDVNHRKAYPNLMKRVLNDKEHYYLFDFNSTIQFTFYDYKPWYSTPFGLYDDFSYLGGITSYYPGNQKMWEKKGLDPDNPLKSIVNSNILVVDSKNYETKLNYLKKYYYPNARKELVDTVDGLNIWKYSVE